MNDHQNYINYINTQRTLSEIFDAFKKINHAVQEYQKTSRQQEAPDALFIDAGRFTINEMVLLKETLMCQLTPEVPLKLWFSRLYLEVKHLLDCLWALPNPVTTLSFRDTCLGCSELALLLDWYSPCLKHFTITLRNTTESFKELWEHEGCQNLESLCLTNFSGPMNKTHAKKKFQDLHKDNFPKLETLKLVDFHCDDGGLEEVVDGVIRVASSALKRFHYDFNGWLTHDALDSLSRLNEELPEHVMIGVSLRDHELFQEASERQVEKFLYSLECRSAPLIEFYLGDTGLQPKQSIRMLKAIESFDLQLPDGGPFEDWYEEQDAFVSEDHMLDHDAVFEQLINSIPRMTKIPGLGVCDSATRLAPERSKQLLNALSKNPRLCQFTVDSCPRCGLADTQQYKDIVRRNIALGQKVPKALAVMTPQEAPLGLISKLLKQAAAGCGEYGADPLYRVLRSQTGKIWGQATKPTP